MWDAQLDKVRSVVVITRRAIVDVLSNLTVAPITSVSRGIRTEVSLGPDAGVDEGSVVSCDNIQTISKRRLVRRRGQVSGDEMLSIDEATILAIASEPDYHSGRYR